MNELQAANIRCRRCELSRKCQGVVIGEGDITSKLMIVIDPPGITDELIADRPRQIFDQIIKEAKIDNYYITAIVKCASYERKGRYKKLGAPKKHNIDACKYWIWNELKVQQPKVVITMGKLATDVLLGFKEKMPLKTVLGNELRVPYCDAVFIPAYSLPYLLNLSEWHTKKTIKYFEKAKEIIDGS